MFDHISMALRCIILSHMFCLGLGSNSRRSKSVDKCRECDALLAFLILSFKNIFNKRIYNDFRWFYGHVSQPFTITSFYFRERLVEEYKTTGDMLVELASDQTSCHNPFQGGYYPVQVGETRYICI